MIFPVRKNLTLASLGRVSDNGILRKRREQSLAETMVNDMQIVTASLDVETRTLSGGNQQKVVIGNWLNSSPKIMIFDEPSRGIDVDAKQQIFQIMWDLSRQGISSLFVSSELEELIEVCHRILIMRNGHIEGEVLPDQVSVEELYELCMKEAK